MTSRARTLRRAASTSVLARHRHAAGQILVLFALGAVVLVGAVGLGVDGSRLLEERRNAQAAVDHAAIAASHASCSGLTPEQAIAAAQASATSNSYPDASPRIVVTVVPVAGSHAFQAGIVSTIDGTFARVLGFTTFDVSVEATAGGENCDAPVGGSTAGAIYAGGNNCTGGKYGVDVTGSNNEVYGGVHSNADASVGGGSNDFDDPDPADDPFTYVGALKSGSVGNGNLYQAGYPLYTGPSQPSPAWPDTWQPAAVGSAGAPPPAGSLLRAYYDLADANGTTSSNDTLFTTKVTAVTKDGVYYTTSTEGMDISASAGVRKVVLVAPNGPIKVSGSSLTWTAITDTEIDALPGMGSGANLALNLPRPGVLMLSNFQQSGIEKCDKYTIAVSGSSSDWNGILWAPGGLIEMSGSSNIASNGSLIGWAVRLNGSDLVIRYDASLFPGVVDPSIIIIK